MAEMSLQMLKMNTIKNKIKSKLGSALRETTGKLIDDVYDLGRNQLGKTYIQIL